MIETPNNKEIDSKSLYAFLINPKINSQQAHCIMKEWILSPRTKTGYRSHHFWSPSSCPAQFNKCGDRGIQTRKDVKSSLSKYQNITRNFIKSNTTKTP